MGEERLGERVEPSAEAADRRHGAMPPTGLARLERLERENRRWRLAMLLTVVVLGSGLLLQGSQAPGLAQERTITAREIRLVDDQGRERAALRLVHRDAALQLFDERGTLQALLRVDGRPPPAANLRLGNDGSDLAGYLNLRTDSRGVGEITFYDGRRLIRKLP